jgi:hypothetical protein
VAFAVLGCSQPLPPPEPAPNPGVENSELGIKLNSVPDGLETTLNEGSTLELRPTGDAADGNIWFHVGPEQHSVNLVATVEDHQAYVQSLSDGEYLGAQELSGDFGVAFYSRGRFSDNNVTVEETVLFLLHPAAGNRLLEIHYRYPAGTDSAARVEKLIEVLAELE